MLLQITQSKGGVGAAQAAKLLRHLLVRDRARRRKGCVWLTTEV